EHQDPDDAAVLQEDGVRGGRPLRRDDEGGQARRIAGGGREETEAAERRAEDDAERCRGDRRAPAGDDQRRGVDCLYAEAARGPEERRARDVERAPALVGHSTVTLFARLRGWSTSVPRCTATW